MRPGELLTAQYDPLVVVLSILAAVLGSYAALDGAERVAVDRGASRRRWLVASALTQGIGIWSMHFTGMLALQLPVETRYHWPLALLSFVMAIGGGAVAVAVVSRSNAGRRAILLAGAVMGTTIVGQHYTAMMSMRAFADHHYAPPLVALSVVCAVSFSLLSLWLVFRFRGTPGRPEIRHAAGALAMATAIVAMHYTGMAAVSFTRTDVAPDWSQSVAVSALARLAMATVIVAALSVEIVSSVADQRRQGRVRLQRAFDEIRALAARLQSVREDERTRLAREIHDELGQLLTAIKIDAASLMPAPGGQDAAFADKVRSIVTLADRAIHAVRSIATELRPGVLDDFGLVAAIEWLTEDFQRRTGVRCDSRLPGEELAIDSEAATALFRILQETLTNVSRHAAATAVRVELRADGGNLVLDVTDNGRGFDYDPLDRRQSLGIIGMRERAILAGGVLHIRRAPAGGTTVSVRIPASRSRA